MMAPLNFICIRQLTGLKEKLTNKASERPGMGVSWGSRQQK